MNKRCEKRDNRKIFDNQCQDCNMEISNELGLDNFCESGDCCPSGNCNNKRDKRDKKTDRENCRR